MIVGLSAAAAGSGWGRGGGTNPLDFHTWYRFSR